MTRTKAQRMAERQRQPTPAPVQKPVADSYQNLQARLGIGADNLASGASYALNPLTRKRHDLDMMYRGSWIVGAAVDAKADDMTRAGIDMSAGIEPNDAEKIQSAFDRLNIWQELGNGLRWGSLYGGAIVVMLIDGQDLASELRMETVTSGQFKGLMVLDRWQLQPSFSDIVADFGPDFGKPAFYTVFADQSMSTGMKSPLFGKKIHYSRVFRFEGHNLPFYQRMAEMGWGMSVVERLYDRLVAFDSATQGMSQLVFKAHLRTLSVEGLTDILGAGGKAFDALVKRVESIRRFQSSEGMTVIDAKDKLEHYNYTFSGLDAVIMQFGQQIAGAIDTPLVRLFGQSPGGIGSTGEGELRTYYDGILRDNEKHLRVPLTRILDLLHRSELGREMPDDFAFSFNPLWQMSDSEKADIAVKVTGAVVQGVNEGLIDNATALKELRKSSQVTGVWSNIMDADIEAAENEPPLPGEKDAPEDVENSADPYETVARLAAE